VLCEPAGPHPVRSGETVCSMLENGAESGRNLVDAAARAAAASTLAARGRESGGKIDERRLYNNLLSSQPLVFNFFGRLKQDLALATELVHALIPVVEEVTDVQFEFAPAGWIDNSAFDVALVVRAGGQKGLLGLECKFTEPFSPTPYWKTAYGDIARASGAFAAADETCASPRFNQLFRNQLIAEHLVLTGEYAFRMTGLFCHHDDTNATGTGEAFRELLKDRTSFHVITFARFLEAVQRLPLTWAQREWSMMLWARYCGLALSDAAYRTCDV
jgi:hypothetical protein